MLTNHTTELEHDLDRFAKTHNDSQPPITNEQCIVSHHSQKSSLEDTDSTCDPSRATCVPNHTQELASCCSPYDSLSKTMILSQGQSVELQSMLIAQSELQLIGDALKRLQECMEF